MVVLPARWGAALAAALVPTLAVAQQPLPLQLDPRPTTASITVEDLMTRLYQVADDSMGGRPTGSEGHVKVTAYIAGEMRRLGLLPGGTGGSYFQDLPVVSRGFGIGASVRVAATGFRIGDDFGPVAERGSVPRLSSGGEIVIGGILGDTSTWISAAEARGKVVVLKWNARSAPMYPRSFVQGAATRFAGAAAVVTGGWDGFPPAMRATILRRSLGLRDERPPREAPVTLVASSRMLEALLASAGQQAALDLRYEAAPAPARNVIAILPGRDPALRGQYVALGAHSDHDPVASEAVDHDSLRLRNAERQKVAPALPPRGTHPARRDSINNGADDDGSGTVALLELAERLATAPTKPRRSVLFVWHVAEELGLWGAEHFTANPTVALDSVVAQLNLDMVGRGGQGDIEGGGPRFLMLVGSRRLSRELGDVINRVNAEREFSFKFDYSWDADGHPQRIYCRSDHALYARHGVPVAFFFTGLHLDYHQVTDEPQYIDYEKLAQVTGLVHDVTLALANRDARPRLDGPKPSPNAACRQ